MSESKSDALPLGDAPVTEWKVQAIKMINLNAARSTAWRRPYNNQLYHNIFFTASNNSII